jgi:hypothetical protein
VEHTSMIQSAERHSMLGLLDSAWNLVGS